MANVDPFAAFDAAAAADPLEAFDAAVAAAPPPSAGPAPRRRARAVDALTFVEPTPYEAAASSTSALIAGAARGLMSLVTLPADVVNTPFRAAREGLRAMRKGQGLGDVRQAMQDAALTMPATELATNAAEKLRKGTNRVAGVRPNIVNDVAEASYDIVGDVLAPGPEIAAVGRSAAPKLPRFSAGELAERSADVAAATPHPHAGMPWFRRGTDLPEQTHGGTTPVTAIDKTKLQTNEAGMWGDGFYTSGDTATAQRYGPVQSRFAAKPEANVLSVDLSPANDPAAAAIRDAVLENADDFESFAAANGGNKGWEQQVRWFAERNSYDAIEVRAPKGSGNAETVWLNPDAVEAVADEADASSPTPSPSAAAPPGTPPSNSVAAAAPNPPGSGPPTFSPATYVQQQVAKRQNAKAGGGSPTHLSFLGEVKRKLVDFAAPIEDLFDRTAKRGGITLRPSAQINNQVDRVLRAPAIAGQFARDGGIDAVIREAPDLDALDQYLIAKHAQTVESYGIKTGRDTAADAQLVAALHADYDPIARRVNEYAQKLLDYSVDAGLVSKDLAAQLKTMYPDYVPLQRVFSEIEKTPDFAGGSGVASLSSQSVVRRLSGSAREIESPIESLLAKTYDAVRQGEKNKAARMLVSYQKLPGNPFQLRRLKGGASAPHTVSFLAAGRKQTYATTREIAAAAKALDVERLNILGKILAAPVRLAKAGITGLNIPFIASNIVRDQLTAFVNSSRAMKTSLANPGNFARALMEAVNHGALYDEIVREGGMFTSFDIARQQLPKTVHQIRAGRSMRSRIAYTVRHPGQLFRAVEDILARSEELTRLQQYRGTREQLVREGMPPRQARIAAARAARENTANFARRGEWGTVLNSAFLYLNAGIQGSRVLVRNLAQRPVQTAGKIAAAVFMPVSIATAWNLRDPERRAAYEDIADFEKDHNLIIVPPHPTKDAKGRWNVIKIPIAPGLDNLSAVPRRVLEQAFELDGVRAGEIAKALVGAVSPVEPAKGEVLSTLTPQIVKPSLEVATNTNLFTGREIVPNSMRRRPKRDQRMKNTSGTARIIGDKLDASPLHVEQFVRSTAGGVGTQALNAFDHALAAAGVIPSEQIGGESVAGAIERRFSKAVGGEKARRAKAKAARRDK